VLLFLLSYQKIFSSTPLDKFFSMFILDISQRQQITGAITKGDKTMLTLYSTRALDRLLNDIWSDARELSTTAYATPIRVKDGVASVSYEVPGIPKDKLSVSWNNNILSVSGKNGGRSINFKVSMPDIATASLKAECVDGILTVSANLKKEEDGTVTVSVS
jgi:HSP20 family molecular chaperone IbpA